MSFNEAYLHALRVSLVRRLTEPSINQQPCTAMTVLIAATRLYGYISRLLKCRCGRAHWHTGQI